MSSTQGLDFPVSPKFSCPFFPLFFNRAEPVVSTYLCFFQRSFF